MGSDIKSVFLDFSAPYSTLLPQCISLISRL